MKITYKNEEFLINKKNPDYNAKQTKIITTLLENEKPIEKTRTYQELMQYHATIKVPGCGSSTGGFGDSTHLGKFTFISVQYPKQSKHRVFMYHRKNDRSPYTLFDNFEVNQYDPPVFHFQFNGDTLLYYDDISSSIIKTQVLK